MTDYLREIDDLDSQLTHLESSVSATAQVSSALRGELSDMQTGLSMAGKEMATFNKTLSGGLKSAFGDMIFEGAKLSDVLRNVAQSMIETTLNSALTPITDAASGLITTGLADLFSGALGFKDGAAFSNGKVSPFAKGGVVQGATMFPMRSGMGLMGEAGPEAIMPLARGADGALGVRAGGGTQNITVNMSISTPDVNGFRRSQAQIAAGISRAMQRGQRNL